MFVNMITLYHLTRVHRLTCTFDPLAQLLLEHSATSAVVVTRLAAAVQYSGHSIGVHGVGRDSFTENPVHRRLDACLFVCRT